MISLNFLHGEKLDPWLPVQQQLKTDQTAESFTLLYFRLMGGSILGNASCVPADVQADLQVSLGWVHMPTCTFCFIVSLSKTLYPLLYIIVLVQVSSQEDKYVKNQIK